MHFILYTEKTVSESLRSITERLQTKGTASRPGLDGWIDKSGMFSISVSAPVIGNIPRRTNLRGKLERENGYTLVRGDVPSGATPAGIGAMLGGMGLVALILLNSGNSLLAMAVVPIAVILFVIMRGDDKNSEYLLDELMKMLRAKETPPKVTTKRASAPAAAVRVPAKPTAAKTSTTVKPTASKPAASKSSSAPKSGASVSKPAAVPVSRQP